MIRSFFAGVTIGATLAVAAALAATAWTLYETMRQEGVSL